MLYWCKTQRPGKTKQHCGIHKSDAQHVSSFISSFQPMWMRQGGPIQTLAFHRRSKAFTPCLDLCHAALWPSVRRLLGLESMNENSELLWGSTQQALVFWGLITFSYYLMAVSIIFPLLLTFSILDPPSMRRMEKLHWISYIPVISLLIFPVATFNKRKIAAGSFIYLFITDFGFSVDFMNPDIETWLPTPL